MSRLSPDPRFWKGNFAVTLPDRKVLVNRSIGYSPNLAWTGQLGLDCVVPNQRWRWQFNGVTQETNSKQQAAPLPLPDARIPVRLELIFDAVHPVWSMKDMSSQDWGSFHIEQGGVRIPPDRWAHLRSVLEPHTFSVGWGDRIWMDGPGIPVEHFNGEVPFPALTR